MSETDTIRVGIAGIRGYKGTELARLIAGHPQLRVAMVASDAMAGGRLSDMDPDLTRDGSAQAVGYNDTVSAAVDSGVAVMLLATRPALCARLARDLVAAGIRVVDLSGAHTVRDGEAHVAAHGFVRPDEALSASAVYGLTELTPADALRSAKLVANPSAYATATLLALTPLAEAGLIGEGGVVIDIKAGASTAGRKAKVALLLSELSGNCTPEKLDRHPHTQEIIERLPEQTRVTIASHTLPVPRGMLATLYVSASRGASGSEAVQRVRDALEARYAGAPFVQLVGRPENVSLHRVRRTNRAVIGVAPDAYGDRVIIAVALDNLVKGTAGQALQNTNLMLGLEQTLALELGTGRAP